MTAVGTMYTGERQTTKPWLDTKTPSDRVHSPQHYASGEIECIDGIKAQMNREEFIGYLRGNIIKYQWRWRNKNGVEDLRKQIWYTNRLIKEVMDYEISGSEVCEEVQQERRFYRPEEGS